MFRDAHFSLSAFRIRLQAFMIRKKYRLDRPAPPGPGDPLNRLITTIQVALNPGMGRG